MNFEHISKISKIIMSDLELWTETNGKKKRNFKFFVDINEKQADLLDRIAKMRKKVNALPDVPLLIYGDSTHIAALFRFTNLKQKNVAGILDDGNLEVFYDCYDNDKAYKVYRFDNETVTENACIVSVCCGNEYLKDELFEKLEKIASKAKVIELYGTDENIPFFCVRKYTDDVIDETINSFAKNIYSSVAEPLNEFYLGIVKRVDKVNEKLKVCEGKKVLVYCAGWHTYNLFRYTNIRYMDVIAIADRDVRQFHGITTRETTAENFNDSECIVISSFIHQNEIKRYLEKIGYAGEIVQLYDEKDEAEFYFAKNVFAPEYSRRGENKYDATEVKTMAESCSQEISEHSDFYVTYLLSDKKWKVRERFYSGEEEIWNFKAYEENKKVAIVIQGPIVYDDDFTYDTIRLYKRIYPGAAIILSTWESEQNKEKFEQFWDLGIHIILNKEPKNRGVLKVNLQVKSASAGIRMAEKLGFEYVIKTRTDFRLQEGGALSYVYNLIKRYPVLGHDRERIAVLPIELSHMPYLIMDLINFGSVKDMKKFWDEDDLYQDEFIGMNPEMHLYSRYFKLIGRYIDNPHEHMEEYIDMLCEELVIVSFEAFKYIWKEYTYQEAGVMYNALAENCFNSIDWFNRQFRKERENGEV